MESNLGFIVALNGCVDFRPEVGRTTFFSWRIGRLRVLVRFLGFRTSLRVGAGQRLFGLRSVQHHTTQFRRICVRARRFPLVIICCSPGTSRNPMHVFMFFLCSSLTVYANMVWSGWGLPVLGVTDPTNFDSYRGPS